MMDKSMVWQAILLLTPLERKHFGQWLASVFHNRRDDTRALYAYCLDCLQAQKLPDKNEALDSVDQSMATAPMPKGTRRGRPKKAASVHTAAQDDQRLRLISTDLLAQLDRFLAFRHFFEQSVQVDLETASAYRKRGLDKHFAQNLRQAEQGMANQPYRHSDYFSALAQIEYERYQWLSTGRRTEALNLQAVSDHTDLAYMSNKLRQACFTLTHQTVFKTEYDLGLLEAVVLHVEARPALLDYPAIGLYYYCYQFLKNDPSDAYFRQFKAVLIGHRDVFPDNELRNLYLLAINYCIKRINQNQKAFMQEALELYQSALEGDILLENGHLSHFAFNNIVAIALWNHDLGWAQAFVEQYHPKLEVKHREVTYRLNLARVCYAQRNYSDALIHLQQADYKDLINNLIAKTLQMKIYYETDEFDVLDAHLQSMEAFIRRQRVIGYHRINYLNIVKYAKKLAAFNQYSRTEREKLKAQIAAETHLTEKEWFLLQLA